MRVRAPGKLVISGAYVVLEGAPALVVAVDRYATADSAREADRVTEEVRVAMEEGWLDEAPWFDAAPLRASSGGEDRKLGLGSSAAVLVAALGTALLETGVSETELADAVLPLALAAHRRAQGGGSGIDVAASCFGGALRCRLDVASQQLETHPHELPAPLVIEVYSSAAASSTAAMLAALGRWRVQEPHSYQTLIGAAAAAAGDAARARCPGELVKALDRQYQTLGALGDAAAIPIVTPAMKRLGVHARERGACFGPAGAGGGDVAVYVGSEPASPTFRDLARDADMAMLPVVVGARGVHAVPIEGEP